MQQTAVHEPNKPSDRWPVALPPQTALQESIHDKHWDVRTKIIFALNDSYLRWHQNAAQRLNSCCNGAAFFIDPATARVKPWISRCHHRMCPYCARSRSGKVAAQLLKVLQQMNTPRMIILTVKSTDRPLADQLRALRQDFAKLRRRAFWKKMITGGAYTVEVTRNTSTGKWHPHLHLIVDGTYIPQKLLRNRWHDVTGSAEIVWIAAVSDKAGAARELAKYIGKPQRVADWPATTICDYAHAVNGARMVQCFGNCHGIRVEDRDEPDTESPNVYSVKLSRLVHLTYRGAETPARLLVLIAERWPQFRSYIYHQLPRLQRPDTKTDRLKRLIALAEERGPPLAAKDSDQAVKDNQDRQLFMAFTRYRADERADVFTDLDYI